MSALVKGEHDRDRFAGLSEERPTEGAQQVVELPGQRTIGEAIRHQAEVRPEATAIVGSSFGPLTYRGLRQLIDEVAAALHRAGFHPDSRLVVALPNGPMAAIAIIAVACAAVAVPLDPKLTYAEVETRFRLLRPRGVIVLRGDESAARSVAERLGLTIIETDPAGNGTLGLQIAVPQIGPVMSATEPSPDAPAFILQTSGTTAQPKLIPFSHRNMLAAAERLQAWFKLTPGDRCLCASPVYYSHGLKVTVLTPLLTGGSVAFPSAASSPDVAEWLGALQPTWFSSGPTVHLALLEKAQARPDVKTMHSLRFIVSGGASLPLAVRDDLEAALGVPVLEHYGSSEAAQIATNLPPPGPCKGGTCGIPWPGTLIIVGTDGHRLRPGERGEILVGGPTLISGYLEAPELNRVVFADGWFRTGDIGSLDEEGFLTLHGRQNELINRGGEKITPPEIDRALLLHPEVAEAAAYAVPHSRLGEDVGAAVVLLPGATVTPTDLREFLRDQLAEFKIPRRIIVLDQLPKGASGKVQRQRLTEEATQKSRQPIEAVADLQASLLQLWQKFLKAHNLTIDDDFFESGGDSLLATEMVLELEKLAGQEMPLSILFEASTVRTLTERLSQPVSLQPKPIIKMALGDDQAPLMFFHGDYTGGGFFMKRLASLLGSEHPVAAIAPHGVGGQTIPDSVEAMAADRLADIVQIQPEGPYRLGGHCVGALVAFETARLLVSRGQRVELVAMVDPATISVRRSTQVLMSALSWILRLMRASSGRQDAVLSWTFMRVAGLQRFSEMSWAQRRAFLDFEWQRFSVKRVAQTFRDLFSGRALGTHDMYGKVAATYFPAPLPVPVVYFRGEYSAHPLQRLTRNLEMIDLPDCAQRRKTPDITRMELPGHHFDWVTSQIAVLAHHLRVRLRRRGEASP